MDDAIGILLDVRSCVVGEWRVLEVVGCKVVAGVEHGIAQDGVEGLLTDLRWSEAWEMLMG